MGNNGAENEKRLPRRRPRRGKNYTVVDESFHRQRMNPGSAKVVAGLRIGDSYRAR